MYFTQTTLADPTGMPWLTLLVALPLVVGLVVLLVKPLRQAGRPIALVASLLIAILAVVAAFGFDPAKGADFQLGQTYPWIPSLGVSWALGVNGIALVMVLLAVFLVPVVLLAAWNEESQPERAGAYAALILILQAFMVLVFASRDLLLFYIAFEGMLIPLYFLIGRFGGENRRHASLKFILYSLAGGLIMLVGVVCVWVNADAHAQAARKTVSLHLDALSAPGALSFSSGAELWVFLAFFAAFAIKAPMVPVHTWLPTTAQAARPGTSALLVGILDKVGTFGMLVYCWALFPAASAKAAPVIIVFAVLSVLYGALAAIWQKDLMRLVSFTSVSHFGFMVMGLYVGSTTAITGALLYMVAHGVSIAALFLLSGYLTQRGGSQEIDAYGGMQRVTPVLAGLFLISGLAAIALPGLSGFLPEYLVLLGVFKVLPGAAIVSVLGVVAAAVYILWPYQRIFTGKAEKHTGLSDLNLREKLAIAPLVLAMFFLGIYPAPVLNALNPVAQELASATSASVIPAAQGEANEQGETK